MTSVDRVSEKAFLVTVWKVKREGKGQATSTVRRLHQWSREEVIMSKRVGIGDENWSERRAQ